MRPKAIDGGDSEVEQPTRDNQKRRLQALAFQALFKFRLRRASVFSPENFPNATEIEIGVANRALARLRQAHPPADPSKSFKQACRIWMTGAPVGELFELTQAAIEFNRGLGPCAVKSIASGSRGSGKT